MAVTLILLSAVLGYGLGSVPFGLVLSQLAGYGDIRKIGSGNIGATNVLRTGNKPLAALTLICDSGKGAAAAGLVMLFIPSPYAPLVAGFFAVIGHNFPVWLGFKGGKGVAAALGTMLAISPHLCAAMCLTWLVMALIFRISSLSALTAFALSPLLAYVWLQNDALSLLACALTALIFWTHRGNIQRLLKGKEPRIGDRKLVMGDRQMIDDR